MPRPTWLHMPRQVPNSRLRLRSCELSSWWVWRKAEYFFSPFTWPSRLIWRQQTWFFCFAQSGTHICMITYLAIVRSCSPRLYGLWLWFEHSWYYSLAERLRALNLHWYWIQAYCFQADGNVIKSCRICVHAGTYWDICFSELHKANETSYRWNVCIW